MVEEDVPSPEDVAFLKSWYKAIWIITEHTYELFRMEFMGAPPREEFTFAEFEDAAIRSIGYQSDRMLYEWCLREFDVVNSNNGWEHGRSTNG